MNGEGKKHEETVYTEEDRVHILNILKVVDKAELVPYRRNK